jgi:predicted secreted protein
MQQGPASCQPPAGAHDRLMQRIAGEPQLSSDPAAPPPVRGLRAMLAAGMMAASIALGIFVGLDTTAVATLADACPARPPPLTKCWISY